jgi:hypothetical protein
MDGERYGGANMIVVLVSEKAELVVRLVQDIEGRSWDREALCDCDESATSAGATSEKLAQQTSSNASNGRKRSCVSRDARRAGSHSKGSRE